MKYVQIKILFFSSGPLLGLTSPPAPAVLRSDVCSPAVVMLSGYRCYCVLPPCWEQVCVCVCRSKDISVTTRGRPKQRIPGVSQMDFIPTPCVCACALSRSSGPVLCSARRSCSAPEGRGTSATPPACRSSGSKTSHWMVSQTCHQWDSIVNMTGVCVWGHEVIKGCSTT